MSVSGLCSVCEANPAAERCGHCGSFVCRTHYDDDSGYCAECAASVGGAGRRGHRDDAVDRSPDVGPGDTYQY